MRNFYSLVCLWFLCTPVFAKQVGEAITDMESVSDTDPNGFKWMIVCIGLLFLVASTLIGVTIMYMMKQKKK